MRIAQLVSNFHKVSPHANQAIYSSVAWLTNTLVGRNNEVSLFASGDSETLGELCSVAPKATQSLQLSEEMRKYYIHFLISKCYNRSQSFDIIHSHFTLLSSFYSGLVDVPTVQSIHSPIRDDIRSLLQSYKNNYYISFSLAQRKQTPELNWAANIYHGVDTQIFQFNPQPQEYMLYLGRITEEKGVHLAIEAAKEVGLQLIIAGGSYEQEGYWHNHIEKFIDGKTVRYVGHADFNTKIEYLKNAKVLLFPTQVEETFGLSMIESLACGTPVIGWNKGSVPEVVQDKETGYVVKDVSGMVKAIKNIDKISRQACRDRAVRLFSVEKMVSGYEKVYAKVIDDYRGKKMRSGELIVPKPLSRTVTK